MRFTGLALKFIYKNFFQLAVFAVIPAVLLSFYSSNSSLYVFLRDIFYLDDPRNSYFYFSIISSENWLLTIGALILIGITISLIFAYLYRTMKVGGKSIKMPFIKLNETLVPVFLVFITFLVFFQLFALIATGTAYLLLMTKNPVLYRVLIPVSLILLYAILFFIILGLLMCIPIMLITGYRYRESISYSIKLSNGKLFKFFFACYVPLIITIILSALLNFLIDAVALRLVIGSICIMFILMYYPSLMMTAYYDITGMNRLDVKRKPKYY